MSSSDSPAFASALGTASTGPMPMISGATPAAANDTRRPIGSRPSLAARAASITTIAAAPSLIWELLPAVTVPVRSNAGCSAAMRASSVSRRMPSSASKRTMSTMRLPVLDHRALHLDGDDLVAEEPGVLGGGGALVAAQPQASWASRSTFSRRATSSPVRPIPR